MYGRILNSLNFIVGKELKEWRRKHPLAPEKAWSWLESLFQRRSGDLLDILAIFAAVTAWVLLTSLYLEAVDLDQEDVWQRFDDWDVTIAGMSLAILALIVPLAIGFVGSQVKASSAKDVFWDIYLDYCRPALLVGSSLAHLTFVLVAQFLKPFISESLALGLSVGGILWMLVNVGVMGWFFRSSFALVGTNSGYLIVEKYVLNKELPRDIEIRLRINISLASATAPAGALWTPKDEGFEVRTWKPLSGEWQNFEKTYSTELQVLDIYYGILSMAIKRIFKSYRAKQASSRVQESDPTLYLPVTGPDSAKTFVFASSKDLALDRLTKLLIYMSYRLGSSRLSPSTNFLTYLQVLPGQVRDAIRESNEQQFELELRRLLDVYASVFDLAMYKDEKGYVSNWLHLQKGMFDKTPIREMLQSIYDISEELLDQIDRHSSYFHSIVYAVPKLTRSMMQDISSELARELVNTHYSQWAALIRMRAVDTDSGENAAIERTNVALTRLVASWDYWHNVGKVEDCNWAAAGDSRDGLLVVHTTVLQRTGQMLIYSLEADDEYAADWAADSLLRWCDEVVDDSTEYDFQWRASSLTMSHVGLDLADPAILAVVSSEFDAGLLNETRDRAIKIALANYWKDITILTSAVLLSDKFKTSEAAARIAKGLMTDAVFINGEERRGTHGFSFNHREFKSFLIRICVIDSFSKTRYSSVLDRYVEGCFGSTSSMRVAGRVYTGVGFQGVSSLSDQIIVLGLASNAERFEPGPTFLSLAKSLSFDGRIQAMSNLENFKVSEEQRVDKIAEALGEDRDVVKRQIDVLAASVDSLLGELRENNNQLLAAAELDVEKRSDFERLISAGMSNQHGRDFPMHLFESIDEVEAGESGVAPWVFSVSGYRTKDVSTGFPDNHPDPDDDWYSGYFADGVSKSIQRSLWQKLKDSPLTAFDVCDDLFRFVQEKRESEGVELVLVANQSDLIRDLRAKVRDGRRSSAVSDIRLEDDKGEGYICSLNGVPVYEGSFRDLPNLLLQRRFFKSLRVEKQSGDSWAKVNFEKDAATPEVGKLYIEGRFDPEWGEYPFWLLDLKVS
jgi:hypothetical protein